MGIASIAIALHYDRRQSVRPGRAALAALLAALVLLLNAMAACPSLHELIHQDADQADHECAVTMFAHGKVESATVDVLIPVPTGAVADAPRVEFSVFTATIEHLPLGRAPPAVSSPQS